VAAGVWGTDADDSGGLFGGRELPTVGCWCPTSDMAFQLRPLPPQLFKDAGTPTLPPEGNIK
jgi:hypothetical protein